MAGWCVRDALFLLTCSTALEIRGEPIAKTEQLAENHCWWCQISFGIVPIKIVGLDTHRVVPTKFNFSVSLTDLKKQAN